MIQHIVRRIAAGILMTCWGIEMMGTITVTDLRTEHLTNPLGIGTCEPRFGWRIESDENDVRQTSYRIIVCSSREKAAAKEGDLWDNGYDRGYSQWIEYKGKRLKAEQQYYWRVEVKTNKGTTVWSDIATWSIGKLTEGDWSGQWIGLDSANPWDVENEHSRLSSRYLRTEFNIDKEIKKATLYISGLGLYQAFINGNKVGDRELAPSPTDYRRTTLYNTYDVTSALQNGDNAIGVVLGNGRFYTMQQHKKTYKITNFGYPKLRANLVIEFADGKKQVVATTNKWRLNADGPIRSNTEYDGEIYDAQKELGEWTKAGYDDKSWQEAERVGGPYGSLRPEEMPGMKVVGTVKCESVITTGSRHIVSFEQNMAGWVKIRLNGLAAGDTVKIRYAETLKDGELYTENLRHAESTDTYIANGKENGTWWRPTFVYHGFRHVEISGLKSFTAKDIIAEKVSDEMEMTGHFKTNNETLNKVYENAVRGIEANYKGMPVDCPQRDERQPWLGDRTVGSSGESYVFDNYALYKKWMRDIEEAQREDGCIPDVAPAFWNYYSDNVTWPAAMPFTLMMLGERYGDWDQFWIHYQALVDWMEHIKERYWKDGLVTKDKYGDWCVPPEDIKMIHSQDPARQTDGTLISTAYYYYICKNIMATRAMTPEEREFFEKVAERTKEAFMRTFLTRKEGTATVPDHILYPDSTFFGNNTVTANLLGLLVTDDPYVRKMAANNIVRKIVTDNKDHISSGVIGISWLMRALADMGRNDVAWNLATQKTYPSWGYMAENGATTTWELWNGNTASPKMNSGNHVMLLGDLITWMYEKIGGLQNVGTQEIELKPDFSVDEIDDIDCSYKSIYGLIVSKWKKVNGMLKWHIEIPANTTATITLPDGTTKKLVSGRHDIEVKLPTADKAIVKDEFLYTEASFPQCHSASIVETSKGDLVATYFGGKHERNPDVCIYVNIKKTGSDKWSEPILAADGVFVLGSPDAQLAGIVDTTTEASAGPIKKRLKDKVFNKTENSKLKRKACWNPVIHELPNGELVIYYKIGLKVADWTGWCVRSKDGGKTWQDREPLQEGFLGPVKNKIVTNKVRMIAPTSIETNGWRLYFELSDDNGKTWRKTDFVKADSGVLAIQPTILVLPDGRLEALCRTRSRFIGVTFSNDNGETWSKLELIETPNNNSGIDAVNLKDGSYALICNDWPIEKDKTKGARTPISLMRSTDGLKWTHWLTLEDSPISQYSYPSIIQTKDGHIHVVYTWRRLRVKHEEIIP